MVKIMAEICLQNVQFIKGWAQKKIGLKKSASLVCFALLFNLMKHLMKKYPYASKERRDTILTENPFTHLFAIKRYIYYSFDNT